MIYSQEGRKALNRNFECPQTLCLADDTAAITNMFK